MVLFTKTYTQIGRRGLCSESLHCDAYSYRAPARTSATSSLCSLPLELLFLPLPLPPSSASFWFSLFILRPSLNLFPSFQYQMGWMNIITKVSLGKMHWAGPWTQALETFYHRLQRHPKIWGLTSSESRRFSFLQSQPEHGRSWGNF